MKPKYLFIAAVVSMLFAFSALAGSGYVASELCKAFHRPNCRYVRRIRPNYVIHFDTREEAIREGVKPCRICKP